MTDTATPTDRSDKPSLRLAEGMLLLTTFIWGGTFAATKVILDGGLGPMTLLSWRFGIAAILFLLFFARRLYKDWTLRTLLVGILLGVLLYVGFGTQTIGLGTTSSSRSGFITALYVVITPLLQMLFGRSRPGPMIWISVLLATTGLWLLSGQLDASQPELNVGDLYTLVCAVVFAVYIIVLDRYGAALDAIKITATQLVVVALCCVVHASMTEEPVIPRSLNIWLLLLYLALFASVFTTWCQSRFQPSTTPSRAALIYSLESVFAAIVGMILLGENLGVIGYIGGGLIVMGLVLAERR